MIIRMYGEFIFKRSQSYRKQPRGLNKKTCKLKVINVIHEATLTVLQSKT